MTSKEPEFDSEQVNLLRAHVWLEADRGSHGIPMSVATDPANALQFVADVEPSLDFAAKELGDRMDRYYKDHPDVSKNGHLWGVTLRDSPTPGT